MAFCKNRRCMRELHEHYWGDGYCSQSCFHLCMQHGNGEVEADYLCDPSDPKGERAIAKTRDEIDAMLALAEIDQRLPKIVYLRKRHKSYRAIEERCGISHQTCYRLLHSVTRSVLSACGLRSL